MHESTHVLFRVMFARGQGPATCMKTCMLVCVNRYKIGSWTGKPVLLRSKRSCSISKPAHVPAGSNCSSKINFRILKASIYVYCIIFILNTHAHVQAEPLQQTRCMHEHIHVLVFVCLCLCIVCARMCVSFYINIHT